MSSIQVQTCPNISCIRYSQKDLSINSWLKDAQGSNCPANIRTSHGGRARIIKDRCKTWSIFFEDCLKTLWRLFEDSCASFRSPLCLKAALAHSSPASSRSLAKFACTFMPSTRPAKHGITSPKNPMQRSITFSRVPLVLKDLKAKSRTCSFLHKASQSKQSKQHCRAYCGCSSQSRW